MYLLNTIKTDIQKDNRMHMHNFRNIMKQTHVCAQSGRGHGASLIVFPLSSSEAACPDVCAHHLVAIKTKSLEILYFFFLSLIVFNNVHSFLKKKNPNIN